MDGGLDLRISRLLNWIPSFKKQNYDNIKLIFQSHITCSYIIKLNDELMIM